MGLKEGDDLSVEQVRRRQGGLAVLELGKAYLGVGIDEGLLGEPPHALERPDLKRILRPTIARTFALKLPMGFLVHLCLL